MDDDKTEFNSNVATLQRIDSLLKKCIECSCTCDLVNWYYLLLNIMKEVIVKLNDKDSKECYRLYNNTKETKTVFDQSQIDKHIHDTFYTHLQDWEIFLRRKMNEKGMLLRDEVKAKITTNWDADDDDSAMME